MPTEWKMVKRALVTKLPNTDMERNVMNKNNHSPINSSSFLVYCNAFILMQGKVHNTLVPNTINVSLFIEEAKRCKILESSKLQKCSTNEKSDDEPFHGSFVNSLFLSFEVVAWIYHSFHESYLWHVRGMITLSSKYNVSSKTYHTPTLL